MKSAKTDLYLTALARAGVRGIDQYRKKLENNAPVPLNVEDLYCEARIALIFSAYRWSVTMRPESGTPEPDLEARLNDGDLLYIEVKHFRSKKQDRLPELKLLSDGALPRLPAIPEGEPEPPWAQMCRRAVKAAPKYKSGKSNLIAFVATTEQLNGELDTAAACYAEKARESQDKPQLENLSAMMLVDCLCTVGPNRQNIWSCPILRSRRVRSTSSAIWALQEIQLEP
jgi:hypothetical protein